jgi:hypothetical protein
VFASVATSAISRSDIDPTADLIVAAGAPLATVSCS